MPRRSAQERPVTMPVALWRDLAECALATLIVCPPPKDAAARARMARVLAACNRIRADVLGEPPMTADELADARLNNELDMIAAAARTLFRAVVVGDEPAAAADEPDPDDARRARNAAHN